MKQRRPGMLWQRGLYWVVCAGLGGGLVGGLQGCDVANDVKTVTTQARLEWDNFVGTIKPEAPTRVAPPVNTTTDEKYVSNAAKNAKQNAEILHEIFLVVYMSEPKDRANFGNWADTLNQGASLEGVYNGLVHSTEYRQLESSKAAPTGALRIFADELALIEKELPQPTQFDPLSSAPIKPELAPPPGPPAEIDFTKPSPSPTEAENLPPKVLADKYAKQFVGASIFVLKKVLGDEALKLVSQKTEYREKLAFWYSKWAVRMAGRNIDFGVPLRNSTDESFHYKWALSSNEDRIKWEVLNRIHRILNDANRPQQ
jgi:hypothetical protein